MARFVTFFFVVSVIISCSQSREDRINSLRIDETDLNSAGVYETTAVIYKDTISAQDCFVLGDTLLIIIQDKQMEGPVVEMVNMESGDKRLLYQYGGGEKQLLSLQAHCDGKKLLLHDYIKRELYQIDIRRLVKEKGYLPKGKKTEIEAQYIIPGKGCRYIYLNPESFEGRDRRILTSTRNHMAKTRPFRTSSFNVVRGVLHNNEARGRQCFIDQHNGIIEFWNRQSLICSIEIEMPVYPSYSNYKQRTYIFKGIIPFSFSSSCTNNQYVAVLFDPRLMDRDENISYFQERPYLLLFDWEGKLVNVQKIESPQRSSTISFASDGDLFFVSCARDSLYVMK